MGYRYKRDLTSVMSCQGSRLQTPTQADKAKVDFPVKSASARLEATCTELEINPGRISREKRFELISSMSCTGSAVKRPLTPFHTISSARDKLEEPTKSESGQTHKSSDAVTKLNVALNKNSPATKTISSLTLETPRQRKLKHVLLKLQTAVTEIKSYGAPPQSVKDILPVVFLLLGHKEKEISSWYRVKKLLAVGGQNSTVNRVVQFKAENLPLEVAAKARIKLESFKLHEVLTVSSGIATLLVWAMSVIEECENLNMQKSWRSYTVL